MTYKTENQIYKDFITFIQTALNSQSITGWDIKKLNQVIKTEDLKPCIFLQIISKKQQGAQYRKTILNKKSYKNKQEVTLRFSATRRFKITDDTTTISAADILTKVKNYIQSLDGIKMLKAKGYAQYRASEVKNQSFINDDENIQLMPFFDCDYLYTDDFELSVNKLDSVRMKLIKGV